MPPSPSLLLTTVAALGAVIGVIYFAAHIIRRAGFAGTAASSRLRLRESLSLDRARNLYLVACDGRELLVLAGPHGDAALGWIPAPPVRDDMAVASGSAQ